MKNISKYKTNINCSACIASVAPLLNEVDGMHLWKVDMADKNKFLTVHGEGITERKYWK